MNVTADGNPNPPTFPLVFFNAPACFAEGVRIATSRGEVAVEDLCEGDEALTVSGAFRPVIWIGRRRIAVAAYPHPQEVNPVRVRAHAFGRGLPARDLMLSPGHAVWIDGALVPVGHLVNGATIVQETVETVHYFHVELDAHDVLLAEGLPCESYLDDGNRQVFSNGDAHVALYGRLDPVDWDGACAPVLRDWVKDRDALMGFRARLHAQAETLGWKASTAHDLVLRADGLALAPLHAANGRLWFQVPAAGEVRLSSHAARPFDLVPGSLDQRALGMAVSEVRVDGRALDLEDAAFADGFMAIERLDERAWRWTDGAARLVLDGPALVEIEVCMHAPHWIRPARQLRLVQAG